MSTLVNAPTARSWRDIPQPVKPRAMSPGGRWRRIASGLRVAGAVGLAVGLGLMVWYVAEALAENPHAMPTVARGSSLRTLELRTDGALNLEWLGRTLAVPRNASLMELDLVALRERLLADGQVVSAVITRRFPDTLEVHVTERMPVARVMAEIGGEHRQLLIARDGVVFRGAGYDASTLDPLPWLDGVAMVRKDARFLPVSGMDVVSDLLAKARLEAEHLYRTWSVISLARLTSDHEIEVRTREPHQVTIIFGANPAEGRVLRDLSFLQQLGRLDYLWDMIGTKPGVQARIDLSLGWQVPVRVTEPAPAPEHAAATSQPQRPVPTAARPATALSPFTVSSLSSTQSGTQREL